MKNPGLFVIVLALLISLARRNENDLNRLPNDRAGEVVKRAIEYAGGWDNWASKNTVEFRKTTIRYKPDGSVERKRVQVHQYVLRPGLRMRMAWEEDGKKIVLINNGQQSWKLVDGKIATAEEDKSQARNATFGSNYVFSMPFKLTDPGVRLTHIGQEKLGDGTLADKVRVEYEAGAGDAGGKHMKRFTRMSFYQTCSLLRRYKKFCKLMPQISDLCLIKRSWP